MSAHHYFRDFNYCDSGMIPGFLFGATSKKIFLYMILLTFAEKIPIKWRNKFNVVNPENVCKK